MNAEQICNSPWVIPGIITLAVLAAFVLIHWFWKDWSDQV